MFHKKVPPQAQVLTSEAVKFSTPISTQAHSTSPHQIDADAWRNDPNAYPLSLSMPLGSAIHSNVFRLITHVGEDCAGAVQFVSPERLETLMAEPAAREIQWLTEEDVAERLRILRANHSAWRTASDTGQFRLAGAQPKTALLSERKRWEIPSGRIPATDILRPPTGGWDGHAENEHFSLQLARWVSSFPTPVFCASEKRLRLSWKGTTAPAPAIFG